MNQTDPGDSPRPAKHARIQFDPTHVNRAPDAIADYVKRQIQRSKPSVVREMRAQKRFDLGEPMLLMPLDENFEPIGETVEVVARNISTGGVGVLHTRSITAKFAAVQLSMPNGSELKMIAEVLRSTPTGMFYDVGMRFVAKIDD